MAADHVPARRLSSPCSPVATDRRRQAAATTPSAADNCACRLPRPPLSWAPSGAATQRAAAEGRHELRSLRAAEAGDQGRTASETMPKGWTVFQRPSTPGVPGSRRIRHEHPTSGVDLGQQLGRPPAGGSAARRCSGSSASARRPSRTPGTLPRSQPPPALGLTGMAANDGNSCTFGLRVRDGVVVEVAHASCRAPVRRPATEEQCRSAPSFNSVDADARAQACASSPPLPAMPLVANLRRRRIRSGSADRRVFCMFRLQVALCIGALQLQHQAVLF